MPKALHFKGDKKVKKRKRAADPYDEREPSSSKALVTASGAPPPETTEDDDSWVNADAATDVAGPVIVVLPTEPASCLACDITGKVFTIPIENFVEDDPATAEPHDVRQVWVANRVAGAEGLSLKGHHGRYLGCDKFGILTASSTAISPEETFTCIAVPNNPSNFYLQTAREKYISIDESKTSGAQVRGDKEETSYLTTFRIRMQARFKPKLKANKEEKAREKISRKALEEIIGRRLEDDEVKKLKKARREGDFHETALDMKVKSKHDKFA